MIRSSWMWASVWTLGIATAMPAAEEYEIGGPLAGVRLEPFPTQHGEPPGYPG